MLKPLYCMHNPWTVSILGFWAAVAPNEFLELAKYGAWHKKLSSTDAGTDTYTGTDTGAIDHACGC